CALKTLLPHMVGPDGGERFVSEGRAAASLKKHPNVVQVFDAGVIDGTPYLAMEFVPGEPLDAMIKRRGQVPENELLEIGHKVALALDHAHQHHIVHRDMKPANVIIDEQGEPHILDFGLAANVEHGLQAEKGVVGTPGYMPPEQVDSKQGTIDNRTDVYSLGATLYAAASGRAPFQETTVTETLVKVLSLAPPRLHTLRPDLTADFCAVIERSMEKQQRHRYASALAFAGDLSLVLAGDPPLARPLSIAGRAVRRMQRHPLLVTMTGLLLLLLCAATIYGRIRQQEMETLWRSVTDQVASQTATEVRGLLEPALPLVRECEALAQAEFLPVRGDQIEFGRHLEKRFRFRELDWLSFGAADGKFTGVWRRPEDGAVLLNRSWPTPEGKVKLQEETIAEDGTREPVRTSEGSDAPAWTEPYDWWGAGGVGITLTLALRGPAGDMEGAFTADVRLASISAFLKGLSIGTSGRAFVLTRENKVTAGPGVKTVNDLPPELATAVAAIGAPLTELVQGVPISVEYNHQGEAFIAAFEVFTVDGGLEWISAVIMPANGFHQGGDRAARYVVWAGLGGVLAMLLLGGLLALFRRKRLRSRMRKRQTRAAFKAPRISR
ncbi:MAG: protein kinase domain-containing protein, partial [Planctomycetota bacterium]